METIWIPSNQVEFLFGKLGADTALAGATVQLRGEFFTSDKGRPLTVKGSPGQIVRAVNCLLFLLSEHSRSSTESNSGQHIESWHYADTKGTFRGPFQLDQLRKWYQQGFWDKDFLVKNSQTNSWLPIWVGVQLGKSSQESSEHPNDVQMADWETEVMSGLQYARQELSWPAGNVDSLVTGMMLDRLPDTPDKVALRTAMDIDTGLRQVMVVVDTNILLTHYATIQQLHDSCGTVTDNVEVVVVVPWIVLLELDDLKVTRGKKPSHIGQCARYALRKLMDAKAVNDPFFRAQSKNDFIEASKVPLGLGDRSLHNDDRILQCCLHQHKHLQQVSSVTEPSCVVLLSNDSALCLKARSAGIKSFRHNEMPLTPAKVAATCFASGSDTPPEPISSPQPTFSASARMGSGGMSIHPNTATHLASLAAAARAAQQQQQQQNSHATRGLNPMANAFQPNNPFGSRSNSFSGLHQTSSLPTSQQMLLKQIEQQIAVTQLNSRISEQLQGMTSQPSASSLPPVSREALFRTSSQGGTSGMGVDGPSFTIAHRSLSLSSAAAASGDMAAALRSLSPSLSGSSDRLHKMEAAAAAAQQGMDSSSTAPGAAGPTGSAANMDSLPQTLQGVMHGNGLTPAIQQALLDLLQTAADLPSGTQSAASQPPIPRDTQEHNGVPKDLGLLDPHPMSPSTPHPSSAATQEDAAGQPFEALLEEGFEILERGLAPVLLYTMQQQQQEEWSYVITDKPPLSARGTISVLEHHWTAAFQDLFDDPKTRHALPARKDSLKTIMREYDKKGRVDGITTQQALATMGVMLRLFKTAKLPDMVYQGVRDNGSVEDVVIRQEAMAQLEQGVNDADSVYQRCLAALGSVASPSL